MTRIMKTLMAGGAALAALAASAPASAQYGYGYNPYGYNQYGYNQYGYGYNANATQYAAQRCSAEVQRRLNYGTRGTGAGILGAILGVGVQSRGQVLSVTRVEPRRSSVRVRGLATSGRYAGNYYGGYGYGAYGAAGYGYQPDLTFRCDVDYRGYVRDVDIYRR